MAGESSRASEKLLVFPSSVQLRNDFDSIIYEIKF